VTPAAPHSAHPNAVSGTPSPPTLRPRLAVFLSGSGRTLDNLTDAIKAGILVADIALVVASRQCKGADKARDKGIETIVHTAEFTPDELEKLLAPRNVNWCVLAGYLRKLPVPRSLAGRVVNIHPALLPHHGGKGMFGDRVHQAVIDAGDTESGCTVHLCDDNYDTGPIVAQARCPVLPTDTARTLADRVFELETSLYPLAIAHLIAGRPIPFETAL